MKKIAVLISFFVGFSVGHWANLEMEVWATHLSSINADNITSGTLDPARVSTLSFTMRGAKWSEDIDRSTTTIVLIRDYDLIVGTPGAIGVHAYVSNLTTFDSILSSVGASGLTTSATAQARIFFKNGTYLIQGATIPRGVTIICDSSAVWKATNLALNIVKIHGRAIGLKLDGNNLAFTSRLVEVSTYGVLEDFELYGIGNQSGVVGRAALGAYGATDVKILNGKISGMKSLDGTAYYGDIAGFMVFNSTDVLISGNKFTSNGSPDSANSTAMTIWGSTHVIFENNVLQNMNQNIMSFNSGVRDVTVRNNRIIPTDGNGGPDNGTFIFSATGNNGVIASSDVYIVENDLFLPAGQTASPFVTISASFVNEQVYGVVIKDNIVYSNNDADYRFASITANGSVGTILQGNHVQARGSSSFITDSGVATLYQTQGNTLNRILQ